MSGNLLSLAGDFCNRFSALNSPAATVDTAPVVDPTVAAAPVVTSAPAVTAAPAVDTAAAPVVTSAPVVDTAPAVTAAPTTSSGVPLTSTFILPTDNKYCVKNATGDGYSCNFLRQADGASCVVNGSNLECTYDKKASDLFDRSKCAQKDDRFVCTFNAEDLK